MSPDVKNQTARMALYHDYEDRFEVCATLNRSLVSYQSNRNLAFYRWFKYKEGFSAELVEHVLNQFSITTGHLLDPFAGTGAALLAGADQGLDCFGIELLPLGVKIVQARLAAKNVSSKLFAAAFHDFTTAKWKKYDDTTFAYPHLKITQGAFCHTDEQQLNQFRAYLAYENLNPDVRLLLELACLAVLESISYTRKDGQYLRWDYRAPRDLKGKRFDKGRIFSFEEAMQRQLHLMRSDLFEPKLFESGSNNATASVKIANGTCFSVLPDLPNGHFDIVVTSPPYCNRYDYTRTYALELAFLGVDERGLKELRQELLTCTVENRSKMERLKLEYARNGNRRLFERATTAFNDQAALQEVIAILDDMGRNGQLNNPNVTRMIRNYFFESSIVVFELARVMKSGGRVVMVNDNVQYAGEEIPVDLILCDFAARAGFVTEAIWVLARGKGNSSQQMGKHGRNELRKCAYVWRRK